MALSPFDPRWDPWGEMRSLREAVNRMWETGSRWPSAALAGDRFGVPVDVTETDNEYRIEASVPGVKRDDVKVSVQNNVVTIEGERKETREQKQGERVTHSEQRYGRFERTFTLGSPVDSDQSRAEFQDGILRLTLPKSEIARPRQIPIQTAGQVGEGQPTERKEVEAPKTASTP